MSVSEEFGWIADVPHRASAQGGNPGRTTRFIDQLKDRPGVWAVYAEGRTKSSGAATSSYIRSFGAEATYRTMDDGTCTVYGRWPTDEEWEAE